MELLCVLAAVAALFCGCAVLTLKCRVPASVAPLTALSAIVAVLTLAAMAGVLYPAAWLLYLLCLAGGVWVAASCRGSTGAAQRLFTPGSVLFWGMALAFTVYFFVRQPMATDFDELSLWATAVKITKVNDSLYATAKLGTPWAATQNPGLPLLAYFFQFFGDYADWKIYVGYDILYFSVFAAVVGAVPREKWRVAVPMAAVSPTGSGAWNMKASGSGSHQVAPRNSDQNRSWSLESRAMRWCSMKFQPFFTVGGTGSP